PSVSIYSHAAHRDLHSFPTRRSSDLALGVDLANADIAILGRDIEVAHDRHRLIRGETLLQQRLQVGVELGLGWKLHRMVAAFALDRKSTRLNSSHVKISYAVFCLKKK